MKNLFIIPGIGYTVDWIKFLTRNWEKEYGIEPHVVDFVWMAESDKFPLRFERMGKYLDEDIKESKDISLLGISAGGSAVVNLFYPRKDKIKKVITVCGRVHDPNVRKMWNHKPEVLGVYEESVKLCETNLDKLTSQDKKRILTIRPLYDEVVPTKTMTIEGAVNERILAAQHMVSISLALSLYSKTIVDFLKT